MWDTSGEDIPRLSILHWVSSVSNWGDNLFIMKMTMGGYIFKTRYVYEIFVFAPQIQCAEKVGARYLHDGDLRFRIA